MMQEKSKIQEGYTLLEVLFAVFMVTSVFLSISAMTLTMMRTNVTNEFTNKAINLAEDKIEALKSALPTSAILADINASNNGNLENTTNVDYQESNLNELGQPGGMYTRTCNISDNDPVFGMKTVVVVVSWTDPTGNHQVSLRTAL